MNVTLAIEIIALGATLISVAGAAVWSVATIKQATVALRDSVSSLAQSVNQLADRIDELERHHADTRERLAAVEARQGAA